MSFFSRDVGYKGSVVEEPLVESRVSDFFELLKPRVMSLVVFTASIGVFRAPGEVHPFLFFLSVLSIAIASGASGVLNMWYERYLDACMLRTSSRPLPSGRIESNEALSFGIILSLGSVVLMGLSLNWFAAFLLLFTIFFLCCSLYYLVETSYGSKYSYRRCCRSFTSFGRLGLSYR
jgi:protoheme IX farnesyltransferase